MRTKLWERRLRKMVEQIEKSGRAEREPFIAEWLRESKAFLARQSKPHPPRNRGEGSRTGERQAES